MRESLKLSALTIVAMVGYFIFGANIITALVVTLLATSSILLFSQKNKVMSKYGAAAIVIAAVIVAFGNIWALSVLLCQMVGMIIFINPDDLRKEIDEVE
ncbi:MAG: hypothetical protein MJ212_06300 [Alphaproteobacteria bacterium]|nr:hypothetical protein [Alphaproteobacteria bacterium]